MLNLSQFMEQPFYWAFHPFTSMFGEFFYAALILVIAGGIYLGTERNAFAASIFLLLIGATSMSILPFFFSGFFLFIVGLALTFITYSSFVEKRRMP